METSLILLGLLAALALAIMLLAVVIVAHSLEAKTSRTAPSPEPAADDESTVEPANTPEGAGKQAKAITGVIASILAGLTVVGILGGFNDGDIDPEVSEIAAGALKGTMVSAGNSDPVVLIVPGSGPTDRNGNGPMIRTDAYKLLAEGLIDRRIATVRIDKRGMFGSAEAGDPDAVTPETYAADIHAWIDAIKAARGSDCVFLMGHSEGALMVSVAAAGRKDVCGLILVAGVGRRMGDVIREQLRSNPANAPILADAMTALAELEAGRDVDTTTMTPALLPLFNQQAQGYLKSVLTIDPVEAVRRAGKKTLILQGDRDLQVSVADARLLDKAPRTQMHIIRGMNHVLKDAPENRAGNLATYMDPALPLADGVLRRIEDFVEDNE